MSLCKLVILDEVNIKFDGLPVEVRRDISNALKFDIPHAKHMPQYKLGRWDGKQAFFGIGGSGYLNHLDVILPIIEGHNITVDEIIDNRTPIDFGFEPITEDYWGDTCWPVGHRFAGQPIRLRDDQVDVINKFLENPQSLQEVSTGAGKTITTATLSKICEKHGRSIVIVPNKSLITQTEADYKNCGLDVGVYYGDRKELNRTHTICTWQSLNILEQKTKDGSSVLTLAEFLDNVVTVIVDEVHQAKAEVLRNLLTRNLNRAPIRWGLTGTVPKEDYDFQGILASIGPIVGRVTAKELQDKGILSQCHVNIVQLLDTKVFAGYQEELKYLVSDDERLAYIAKMVNKIKNTGNTLVLVDRLPAGEKLSSLIPGSVFIRGEIKEKDRKSAYDDIQLATNGVIVATYGVAAVGINIPRIFNVVLLEPGKSFVRVIQSIGRGIRKANDKDFVQIWDVTSTCKYAKRHLTQRKKFYTEASYPFAVEKIDWNKN